MSDPLHLFRYRDLLTDDTLAEHRRLIDERGACWWGWWQRPAEDPRFDVWEALLAQLAHGPVEVALFNSGPEKGQVHFARLEGIIPPKAGGAAPSVPEAERELIPGYYRDTPFSSAWMRLTHIRSAPAEEFFARKYSYARPPQVPGVTPAESLRFIDKIVLDADELRTMDTTVWQLRDARPGDRDERILTANSRLTRAKAGQPVLLRSNRVLHLSDLHFATPALKREEHRWELINEGPRTLHERLSKALGEQPDIGLVIVSGDLTFCASDGEFYEASRFLHALLGWLKLGPEHLVVVPGNHDIAWTKQAEERWDYSKPVTAAPDDAKRAYRIFYERVFRHEAALDLGMARRFVLPSGICLEIGALNSSNLESGRDWLAGMGSVPDGAWDELSEALGWDAERGSHALRWLVLHHHVTATEDVLPAAEFERGFGMAVDAKQTLRKAARKGVQLILHGHRHQPYLGIEHVYGELERSQDRWDLGRVSIVGGGSAGSTAVKNDNNFFNLFELEPSQLELAIYSAHSPEGRKESFHRMHTWRAELGVEGGRVVLGDWKLVRRSEDAQ